MCYPSSFLDISATSVPYNLHPHAGISQQMPTPGLPATWCQSPEPHTETAPEGDSMKISEGMVCSQTW